MTSPFPGMDPYLEGYLWHDVHGTLAVIFKELIVPQLPSTYVARIEHYNYLDTEFVQPLVVVYPDVEVLQKKISIVSEPETLVGWDKSKPVTPPALTLPPIRKVKVGIPHIEIFDKPKNTLVTSIEILSPVNKRNPGLETYRKKRSTLQNSGVNLLEIDLLRGGTKPLSHASLPPSDYRVLLWRASSGETEAWTLSVRSELPVVPVPLKSPDPDVKLDIGNALQLAYERSYYWNDINYTEDPPPPALSEKDWLWMRQLLQQKKQG